MNKNLNKLLLSLPLLNLGVKINLILWNSQAYSIFLSFIILFLVIDIDFKYFISKNYIMIFIIFYVSIPFMFFIQGFCNFFSNFFNIFFINLNIMQSPLFYPRSFMLFNNFFNFSRNNFNVFIS